MTGFNFTAGGQPSPQPQGGSGFNFTAGGTPQQAAGAGVDFSAAPPAMPFMAQAIDKYGLPYYGEGLGGFARKVFAKIFDPDKLLPKPTQQQAELLERGTQQGADDLREKGWDEFIGKWTGISPEDIARISTATALAVRGTDEEGQVGEEAGLKNAISTGAGILYRGGGQVISGGLEALGLLDKASRKVQAVNVVLDEVGDTASILPDISSADTTLFKLFGENETTQRLGNFLNAFTDLAAPVMVYNLIRAASSGAKLSDTLKAVKDNVRASNMIYTMYWDEAKKEEYFRRAQAGENPDLLMRELENPWVELAGSIFGDPSTYMGIGIISKVGKAKTPIRFFGKKLFSVPWEVVRLPGFSELTGLKNIGRARLASAGDDFTKIASPQTERALQALENAGDDKAVEVLKSAVDAARKQVREFSGVFDETATLAEKRQALKGTYGIFAHDSSAKAEITKKTVGTFMQTLAARFRNPDDIMETFRAYKNLMSEDNVVATRSFMHLKEVYGTLPFSNVGMQSMEFMTRLIDEVDIGALVAKHGNDIPSFSDEALKKLNGVVDDMFPSFDDLAKAKDEVKTLGQAANARQLQLAKSYDDIIKARPQVAWANSVNKAISGNKVYQGLQGFYAGVLMGMRPAYAVRNLLQNSVVIFHDLGLRAGLESLVEGFEVFARSGAGRLLKQDWVTPVLTRHTDEVKKILGFVPTEMLRGTGSAGREGFGFLAVGQDIEKVHSAIITRYVVESEMEKFVRYGGIPDVGTLGLPREMAESLVSHVTESYGNVKETLKRFRADQASGFFETWRHLELDPRFKDTLRRSNLLDELEDIRKVSPDAATFSDRMDAFINKIDELAQRTANEPALVSGDNPMSDVVVTIEKAFDEGKRKIMSEEELNQFRALTELRGQLRNKFQDYVDVMRDRIGRNLPPEQVKPFEERFSQLRQVLEDGNSKWRGYADEVYNGIYARSKKGEPVTSLWGQARTVMMDVQDGQPVLKRISMADDFPNVRPEDLTNSEFSGMLWKWFKEKQSAFWRSYTQEFMVGQERILEEMASTLGTRLDEFKMAEYGDLANPRLQQIVDLTEEIRGWETSLDYESFRKLDMSGKTLSDMTGIVDEFPNWQGGKSHLFNAVNADRAARSLTPYSTIDEVPFEEAVKALQKRSKPIPPYVETTTPTVTRQLYENMRGGLREALEDFRNGTLQKWGEKVPIESSLTDEIETGLSKWAQEVDRRMTTARASTAAIANETRNFILHDYNKTYADKFASFFTMYHYWPSRTYARWGERVLDTPGTISTYAKWRASMEKIHSDQPEFYRYNMTIPKLPGLNNSPMFFNLESTLNPLYSLTGVDFNDPKRRVDWLSSAVDDMGKFGFNTAMPLQWAMAFRLYTKGEDEAARRWLGRLIPATQDLKAGLNLLKDRTGIDLMPDISILPGTKYGEFDPFINFQGGFDAYEEKRIGRALANMVEQGELSPEQAYDIMYNRQGEEFDQAVMRAINERAPGQMSSYFMGVGFKTRTEGDLKVQEFYDKYYKLLAVRESISPDEYRRAFDQLRGEYKFSDTVLLSARGGDDRDAVYAYNVLSRIPPGDSYNLLTELGLSNDLVQKFYNDKGNFADWTPQDRERFMGVMLDIGATLTMPDDATRQEWNEVKSTYASAQEEISKELGFSYQRDEKGRTVGRGVWDVVSTYYDLKDSDQQAADDFKAMHPEVDMALSMLGEIKVTDPLVARYYASLDTVEGYYAGRIRMQLFEEFGADITQKQTEYYALAYEGKAVQKAYLKSHPELMGYWSRKRELEKGENQAILRIASSLPQAAPGAQLREDFTPANATQELLAELSQGAQAPSWAQVSMPMSTGLQGHVAAYWLEGQALSNVAIREMEYLAKKEGYYDVDDYLRTAGLALMQEYMGAQQAAPPPQTGGFNFTAASP